MSRIFRIIRQRIIGQSWQAMMLNIQTRFMSELKVAGWNIQLGDYASGSYPRGATFKIKR